MIQIPSLRLAITTLLASACIATGAPKPNIVMIYVDDWAWGGSSVKMDDSNPNSANGILTLPNVERMAAQGMKFSNAYGSHQCAPARASLQTGQSVARTGFTLVLGKTKGDYYDERPRFRKFPMLPNISDPSLDPDAVTIPEVLNPMGYVSAHLGKWHLYSDPGAEGYVLHSGDTTNNEGNILDKSKGITPDFKDPKLMFSLTDQGIRFMEEQTRAKRPFYLQISHYAVHNGSEALHSTFEEYKKHPALADHYGKRPSLGPAAYFAMTRDMDTNIGRILDSVEALGIKDNTYVILVSDNGYRRKDLLEDPNFTQPLHGHKWWAWEAGIRVPMIVNGPDIPKGSVFQENVVNYDFLPTFVDWAGGDPDALANIDGVSLAPYMRGTAPDKAFVNRPIYFHVPHYRGQIPHSTVISGDYKLMHFYDSPDTPMLFDLSKDPGERSNVASNFPEKHGQLMQQMMGYLNSVDAKFPKENPNFDAAAFQKEKDYEMFQAWGAFEGNRPLGNDES